MTESLRPIEARAPHTARQSASRQAAPHLLDLIERLCEALAQENVSYCQWKSCNAIDGVARGDHDLDLLIGRSDVQRFTEIVHRLGFKEAWNPAPFQIPGILNYYGYDLRSGKLVHVHAHYQLVVGHDMNKNYHLPIEKQYLDAAVPGDFLLIPPPEFELIIFVIRMMIKHATWDAILGGQGSLSRREKAEFEHLQQRVDRSRMLKILQEHVPFLDPLLFDKCLLALSAESSVFTRMKVAHELQVRLRPHARRSWPADLVLKVWRRAVRAFRRRIVKRMPKKRLTRAGAMIAIIGGDGAGKSTAVDDLSRWLSEHFETKKVHLGKPPKTWTTIAATATLKLSQLMGISPRADRSLQFSNRSRSHAFPGYLFLIRQFCLARDRLIAYRNAHRFAVNGGLVICDRFPLPQIKLMDGPKIEQLAGTTQPSRVLRRLIDLERRYHEAIMAPEMLVVLRVDPEIAVQRKVEESADAVRSRSREIWEMDWQQTGVNVIDASQSRVAVLSELKSVIWQGF